MPCCGNLKFARCVAPPLLQEELNLLYEGHIFNIAIRYPISLNTLFVALTYWCVGGTVGISYRAAVLA